MATASAVDAMTAVANGGEPARLQVVRLTASMFDVLRVHPLRGRAFTADDERYDGGAYPVTSVAILSYGLWQEWFGGRDSAIGEVVPRRPAGHGHRCHAARLCLSPTGRHARGFQCLLEACWAPPACDASRFSARWRA